VRVGNRWVVRHWSDTFVVTLDPKRSLTDDERSSTAGALFMLMHEFEARDPEVLPVVRQVHAALFSQQQRFAPRLEREESDGRASERIERELEQAVKAGRLLIVPEARPVIRLAVTDEAPVAPELAPAPEATPTFFEVRFVDEVGEAISGLAVVVTAEGKPNNLTTSGGGVARLDGVRASFASVQVASMQALRDIMDPRWEKFREGDAPAGPDVLGLILGDGDLESLSLEGAVPKTVVIRPPLGRLSVELFDKTGRFRHDKTAFSIKGPMSFEGETDELGRLEFLDVLHGDYTLTLQVDVARPRRVPEGETPPPHTPEIDEYESVVVALPPGASAPQVRMLGVLPQVVMARLRGMLFDTNKNFLLPSAIPSLKKIRQIYELQSPSELLVVGHTDTTAQASVNDPLSVERADSMAAYLKDEVDPWLAMYGSGKPESKRWGAREDQMMLSALPDFLTKPPEEDPVVWFQRTRELKIDGIAGPQTRTQLITEYMQLDGVTLEEEDGIDITITTHGCGENFPVDDTGQEIDTNAADSKEDQLDRRVELFFFDKDFGIRPPPPGKNSKPGSTQYPEWRARAEVLEDAVLDESAVKDCHLAYEVEGLDGELLVEEPFDVTVDEEEVEGTTSADGVLGLSPLAVDEYRVRVGDQEMFLAAFPLTEAPRRIRVLPPTVED